jgi:hypothetical protein
MAGTFLDLIPSKAQTKACLRSKALKPVKVTRMYKENSQSQQKKRKHISIRSTNFCEPIARMKKAAIFKFGQIKKYLWFWYFINPSFTADPKLFFPIFKNQLLAPTLFCLV